MNTNQSVNGSEGTKFICFERKNEPTLLRMRLIKTILIDKSKRCIKIFLKDEWYSVPVLEEEDMKDIVSWVKSHTVYL
jgi:hypothetical protein